MGLKEYVVLDIETTGLSRYRHKITEIAALKFRDGEIVEKFQSLVNPEVHIPSFITRLTGIDDEMVKDKDTIDTVLPNFIDFLGDSVIVAHCATFDYGFINHNVEQCMNKSINNEKLCTRKLANRLLNDLPSKKLSHVCNHFDIINEQAHRAMGDVKATAQVFSNFLKLLDEKGISSENEIMDFETMSQNKIRRMYPE